MLSFGVRHGSDLPVEPRFQGHAFVCFGAADDIEQDGHVAKVRLATVTGTGAALLAVVPELL
jgi:hypothetical protein